MESSQIQDLCQNLICSAIQRCRMSENLCRLSVLLKCSLDLDLPIVRISISDTGVGCCLTEFRGLRYAGNHIYIEKWDGVLYITTTSISDEEIYHYNLNLKENMDAKRLTRLPSSPKNGGKFSGTEVSLSTLESVDEILRNVTCLLQKVRVLKIPIAVELVVERINSPGSGCESVFLEDILLPYPVSNSERLISGFKDYVLKHENTLDKECNSCFPCREQLKIGSGVACSIESLRSPGQVIESVIVITELPESSSPSCMRTGSTKTEVLYFHDFALCPIPQSSLNALTNIDWKSYGLSMKANVVDRDGQTVLEWENLPAFAQVHMVIHCYHKKIMLPDTRKKVQFDKNLLKKAVKLAMDDLKEKYAGILLSSQALKIRSYAPDLARTISGLVLSSNDSDFQEECLSLLGLQSQKIGEEMVEDCIKSKIIRVIEMNDRKPQRNRASAPFLFEDEDIHAQEFQDSEDADEEELGTLDLQLHLHLPSKFFYSMKLYNHKKI